MSLVIPDWLSHLKVDRRGLPVPFVNRWGLDENTDLLSIEYDPNVKKQGMFYDDSKEEIPNFTSQNMQRQRACMVRGLCQVCANLVPFDRRTLVISDMSIETIKTEDGQKMVVVTEPWLCFRCAMFAVDRCPGIIRRKRDENLTLVQVTSPRDYQLITSVGWTEGPLEEESRKIMPVMWVKIALSPKVVQISTAA